MPYLLHLQRGSSHYPCSLGRAATTRTPHYSVAEAPTPLLGHLGVTVHTSRLHKPTTFRLPACTPNASFSGVSERRALCSSLFRMRDFPARPSATRCWANLVLSNLHKLFRRVFHLANTTPTSRLSPIGEFYPWRAAAVSVLSLPAPALHSLHQGERIRQQPEGTSSGGAVPPAHPLTWLHVLTMAGQTCSMPSRLAGLLVYHPNGARLSTRCLAPHA